METTLYIRYKNLQLGSTLNETMGDIEYEFTELYREAGKSILTADVYYVIQVNVDVEVLTYLKLKVHFETSVPADITEGRYVVYK
jgi:hypothetical protein